MILQKNLNSIKIKINFFNINHYNSKFNNKIFNMIKLHNKKS